MFKNVIASKIDFGGYVNFFDFSKAVSLHDAAHLISASAGYDLFPLLVFFPSLYLLFKAKISVVRNGDGSPGRGES